ncbi:MAG TPA: hypothetical protein VLB49_06040 [Gemmatimonadales bacterium]|nr:hypothetical protein [Gemmatimonadales bacterium]
MRPRRRRIAGALACVLFPVSVTGQSRWERQVGVHVAQASATLVTSGYVATPGGGLGTLNNGETAADTVTLAAGFTYVLVGVCDDDCRGLELGLFAANGYEVDAARRAGNAPIVRVTPRETQRFRLVVRMTGCGMNPCWYGVRAFRRSAHRSP